MMDENLAENISLVLDAIIDDVDEPDKETLAAELILTRYSWNNQMHKNYAK
jgi:hypothetical protein